MTQNASFERCPPLAWGACMRDRGYESASCALAATCCVRAPMDLAEIPRDGGRAPLQHGLGRSASWKPDREKVAA